MKINGWSIDWLTDLFNDWFRLPHREKAGLICIAPPSCRASPACISFLPVRFASFADVFDLFSLKKSSVTSVNLFFQIAFLILPFCILYGREIRVWQSDKTCIWLTAVSSSKMQKTDVDPDDNVLDSWEDLDDTVSGSKLLPCPVGRIAIPLWPIFLDSGTKSDCVVEEKGSDERDKAEPACCCCFFSFTVHSQQQDACHVRPAVDTFSDL